MTESFFTSTKKRTSSYKMKISNLTELNEIIKETLIVLFYLFTVNILSKNIGNWHGKLNDMFASMSFFAFSMLLFSSLKDSWNKIRFQSFILVFLVACFIFLRVETEIKFIVLGIFLLSMDLILRKNGIHKPILSVLTFWLIFYIIFIIFTKNIPAFWYFLQYISQTFSKNIAKLIGKNLFLGATPSGIYITILFVLLILAYFALSERRKGNFLIILSLLTVFLNSLYLALHFPILSILTKIFKTYIFPTDISIIYILLLSIPLFFLLKKVQVEELPLKLEKNNFRYLFICIILIFFSFFLLNYHPIKNKKGGIYLFEEGYLNWDKPDFERYGGRSWGMFGMLPEFLRNIGFEVKKDRIINKKNLKETKVLVLMNLNRKLNFEERKTIWDFVQEGGSLLCLGDHTGMQGIRDPFNELLKPYKIEFNFDCGHYLKRRWKNDFEFMNHPITFALKSEEDTGIGVGASLKAFFTVIPVIIAKYGFSDRGNPNDPKNGYLGDRKYKNGELLGDIILVAEKRHKKGKVLVFGDTSSFQNLSLTRNPLFVERVFRYLSSESNWILRNKNSIFILIFLIGLFIFFQKLRNIIAFGILLLVIALSYQFSKYLNKKYQTNVLSLPQIVFIDLSHLERISLEPVLETGTLGITTNLIRNGYNPVILKEFSKKALFKSKIFMSIAPSKNFTGKEIGVIKEYIREGGIFILSVGYEEKKGSENLLKTFGLDILNIPLGPVPPNKNSAGVQFYNAWPIIINKETKVICRYKNKDKNYPIIVFNSYGKGKFILVSDSNFLCDVNLENINYYFKENISFIKMLLHGEFFK